MYDHVSTLIPSDKRVECLQDIDKLQLSKNDKTFRKASQLFLEKYAEYDEFVAYFNTQWLALHRNWYEGASVPMKAPSCNNGLEVFNRTLKDEKTLRRRLPLQVFFNQLLTWIHTWGSRYIGGANVISNKPVIDMPLMTKGYQWKKENKIVKKNPDGFLMVPAGKDIDLDNWGKFRMWETFDEFKTIVPIKNWIDGTCNCPSFFKDFMCKHVIGIAIRLKLLEVPFGKTSPNRAETQERQAKASGKSFNSRLILFISFFNSSLVKIM